MSENTKKETNNPNLLTVNKVISAKETSEDTKGDIQNLLVKMAVHYIKNKDKL